MRLIDEDALVESLGLVGCYKNSNREAYNTLMKYEIVDAIEDQPTAYDVDKVVERLTEEYEDYLNRYEKAVEQGRENEWRISKGTLYGLYCAIDIVKRGGINENNSNHI